MYGENVKVIDLQGRNISCGLIDIQINGGRDRYFSASPDLEAL
jgi:N-acetylglucosamine-6-phosphate deacetylase